MVKGHQLQVKGKWKVETELNDLCERKEETARSLTHEGDVDPFFPDQKYGITWAGRRFHGCPREAITVVYHATDVQTYISEKSNWILHIFKSVY